jgi:sugar/nucleoside kinase (ribokinase family)
VGNDLYSHFVIEELARRGIDVQEIITDPNVKTGVGVILSRGVDRAILTYLGAIAKLSVANVDPSLLAQG